MKVGIAQTMVTTDPAANIENARQAMEQVLEADIILLPEMWNCPYDVSLFHTYAQNEQGAACSFLSAFAKAHGKYIVGGSIPEIADGLVYNTCFVFDPTGKIIARHRKIHLFDIDVVGGQQFCESAVLSSGNSVTVFDTEWCKIGVCICYDYRFPELARLMAVEGASVILVPAAFNMTTGPAHWELMFRSRSVDNQVYSIGAAPARDNSGGYVSYASSIAVSPWGEVVAQLKTGVETKVVEVDLARVAAVREQLPLLAHRRTDLYKLEKQKV